MARVGAVVLLEELEQVGEELWHQRWIRLELLLSRADRRPSCILRPSVRKQLRDVGHQGRSEKNVLL